MMGLAAGKLRHRLRVEQQVQVKNSFGETEIQWESIGIFWAEIRPMSSREMMMAQQTQSQLNTIIVMRFNPEVLASMRGIHLITSPSGITLDGGTVYNFSAPIPDPESGLEWMTIPCTSGINEG